MPRARHIVVSICVALLCLGIARCGSDPNLEGAKLDLRSKDFSRALENIAKALEADPNNSEALALKGEIVLGLLSETTNMDERAALMEEMAQAYRRSVEIDASRFQDVERRLHVVYLREFNAGIEAYSEAVNVGAEEVQDAFTVAAMLFRNASTVLPDSVSAYVNEAMAYYSGGMFSRAVEAYEAALSLGHTARELFVYLARVMDLIASRTAVESDRSQLYLRAVRVLERGLQHHAGDAELRDMLLNYYAHAGEPQEAIAYFESQYEEKREDRVYLYNYGTLLLTVQDYIGAIAKLADAVRLDPGYTKARFNLGAAMINEAVGVIEAYNAISDSLDRQRSDLAASTQARMETRQKELDVRRQSLFHGAIEHLEIAKNLAEDALEQPRDICRALFRAYGHTNQRSKADAVTECAAFGGQ